GRSRGKLGSLALGRGARHSFPGGQKRWGRWKSFAAWRLGTIVSLPLGHPLFQGQRNDPGNGSGNEPNPPATTQTKPAGEGLTGEPERVRPRENTAPGAPTAGARDQCARAGVPAKALYQLLRRLLARSSAGGARHGVKAQGITNSRVR